MPPECRTVSAVRTELNGDASALESPAPIVGAPQRLASLAEAQLMSSSRNSCGWEFSTWFIRCLDSTIFYVFLFPPRIDCFTVTERICSDARLLDEAGFVVNSVLFETKGIYPICTCGTPRYVTFPTVPKKKLMSFLFVFLVQCPCVRTRL